MDSEQRKVHKKVEVVGSSSESVSDAVQQALKRADETLHNMKWFEVTEIRGYVENAEPVFQVSLKIGLLVD